MILFRAGYVPGAFLFALSRNKRQKFRGPVEDHEEQDEKNNGDEEISHIVRGGIFCFVLLFFYSVTGRMERPWKRYPLPSTGPRKSKLRQ